VNPAEFVEETGITPLQQLLGEQPGSALCLVPRCHEHLSV
jgi:hypothetical protein